MNRSLIRWWLVIGTFLACPATGLAQTSQINISTLPSPAYLGGSVYFTWHFDFAQNDTVVIELFDLNEGGTGVAKMSASTGLDSVVRLGKQASGDTDFVWTIPTDFPDPGYYSIRVMWKDTYMYGDTSNSILIQDTLRSITVTSPAQNDSLTEGEDAAIQWNSTGDLGQYLRISHRYCLDYSSCQTTVLTEFAENTGQATVSVPVLNDNSKTSTFKVESVAFPYVSDQSDPVWVLDSPKVEFTNPQNGELWYSDSTYTVSWQLFGPTGNVSIYLEKDGTVVDDIVSNTSATSANYTVDPFLSDGNNYRIRAELVNDPNLFFLSDPISIEAFRSISIISPSTSTAWRAGKQTTIQWSHTGYIDTVDIYLGKGSPFLSLGAIALRTPNTGTYNHLVPSYATPNNDYRLRIVAVNDNLAADTTGFFQILEYLALSLSSPSTADTLLVDSTYQISWSTTGTISSVSLELMRKDDNNTLLPALTIAESVANTDSYNWTVPNSLEIDSTYSIIIRHASDSSTADTIQSFLIATTEFVNTPPTISSLTSLSIPAGSRSSTLDVSISDPETPAGDLMVYGSSTDPTLIPVDSIRLGGSGTDRTVIIGTIPQTTGLADITLTVRDPFDSASTTFTVNVTSQTAPRISGLQNAAISLGTASHSVDFTIEDDETAAADLTLEVSSSNTGFLPTTALTLGGTGSSRSLGIDVPSDTGHSTITITVSDGLEQTSGSIEFSVYIDNTAPSISSIDSQTVTESETNTSIPFTISDPDDSLSDLTVRTWCSDSSVLPGNALVLSGSGSDYTLTITPPSGTAGSRVTTYVAVFDQYASDTARFITNIVAQPVLQPPVIDSIPPIRVEENGHPISLSFRLFDEDTEGNALTIAFAPLDTSILPKQNIEWSLQNDTISVILSTKPSTVGSTPVTVSANDGTSTTSRTFSYSILQNTPPVIQSLENAEISINTSSATTELELFDEQTSGDSIGLEVVSSNTALIPNTAISWSLEGNTLSIAYSPTPGVYGASVITLTAWDYNDTTQKSFVVNIIPDERADTTIQQNTYRAPTRELIWRPVGFSYVPSTPDPLAALGFADYDSTKWKIARWSNDVSSYIFLNRNNSHLFRFERGTMQWVITREALTLASPQGDGRTADTLYTTPVPPGGWHDFVCPYIIPEGISFETIFAASP